MNPLQVITDALRSIPAQVRKAILLTFAIAAVALQILALLDAFDWDYGKINAVLAIIGGYLGFQSAANVPAPELGGGRVVADPPGEPDAR
jgi:hypothetical protein